ncbi:fungal specific transcription factor domain-containing protein [Aspergillus tanneri]|uniref:Zn(2)-C6 fungal-type domain-containing protein n=2 Tax=Aspergillus tanneri TaxID=1220188 RepID=A0A5M9MZ70_9EURO|nr:uncharacterized protein ATNIH1004_000167 [Aspergillus tanneri]KAA8651286.1 hypothetical protein ATNIH1004_000167 [Aspergillus tanneri]
MQSFPRRRKVSSCIPCYTRKQKCNRQYPCNHCTRRRRPEGCAYYPSEATQHGSPTLQTANRHEDTEQSGSRQSNDSLGTELSDNMSQLREIGNPTISSIAEIFGYSEDSKSNTMGLIQRLRLREQEEQNWKCRLLPHEVSAQVQQSLRRMPDRPILDFLVRFFVAEVNWINQLVHPPWFLEQYQLWWAMKSPSSEFEIELAVLILRVCSYASQFLPSPSYTIESIWGMLLSDIQNTCDDIAGHLAEICTSLNPRGSLLRVQHLAFAGFKSHCEGGGKCFQ